MNLVCIFYCDINPSTVSILNVGMPTLTLKYLKNIAVKSSTLALILCDRRKDTDDWICNNIQQEALYFVARTREWIQ